METMAARAIAKYIRLGPRKVGQLLNTLKGKSVDEAYNILRFTPRRATIEVEKVIKSAVSNLKSTKDESMILIKEAFVGRGPGLTRMKPRAMGRGVLYERKTCHITVEVEEAPEPKKKIKKEEE